MTIAKGLAAIKEAANSGIQFLKLKDGESALIRFVQPMDEIISVYEHVIQLGGRWQTITCLGKDKCPICATGDRANFAAYLVVLHRNDGDKVKVFKAGKRAASPLITLAEEYGDLRKRDFKVSRQGSKQNTVYTYLPRDPEPVNFDDLNIPDIEALVAPMSVQEIEAILARAGEVKDTPPISSSDDDYPF